MRKRASSWIVIAAVLLCVSSPFALATEGDGPIGISPTTGMPCANPYRPVLVQISNSENARPPEGLAMADIVYEAIYWGPYHTAYLALFNDEHPERVGYVHNTRMFWFVLREMWDCPIVFWGTQGQSKDESEVKSFLYDRTVAEEMLFDGNGSNPKKVMWQDKALAAPYNAMVSLDELVKNHWPVSENGHPYCSGLPDMKFGDEPLQTERTAHEITVAYEETLYAATYVYEENSHLYTRWYNGVRQEDAQGSLIEVSNVIVQYVKLSYQDGDLSLPIVQLTGSGPVELFVKGQHIRGTWNRDAVDEWIDYVDENGSEVIFYPGKTFVQIIPMEMSITTIDAQGRLQAYQPEVDGATAVP